MSAESQNNEMELLLKRLGSESTNPVLTEPDAERMRKISVLKAWFQTHKEEGKPHLSLEALKTLADARRTAGDRWEMPLHLTRCALCLEAFELVREGLPQPSEESLARYRQIPDEFAGGPPVAGRGANPSDWRRSLMRRAAVFAVILGIVVVAAALMRPRAVRLTAGTLVAKDTHILSAGASVPAGVLMQAREDACAVLNDGSTVDIDGNSTLSFRQYLRGSVEVALIRGKIMATVTRQKSGRSFSVKTGLGEIRVEGTRFSVEVSTEKMLIFKPNEQAMVQSREEEIPVVSVEVDEGLVNIQNSWNSVQIPAGRKAVLRGHQQAIEVTSLE